MNREQAIDLLDNLIGAVEDNHGSDYDGALKLAIKALEEKPKTGRWLGSTIQGEIDGEVVKSFICSECYAISVFRMRGGIIVNGNLCPNCGAKMNAENEA